MITDIILLFVNVNTETSYLLYNCLVQGDGGGPGVFEKVETR